jgi:hypothetical protein
MQPIIKMFCAKFTSTKRKAKLQVINKDITLKIILTLKPLYLEHVDKWFLKINSLK